MRRYLNIAAVAIMIAIGIAPGIEGGVDEGGLSLAVQLDGLPPEARIAYLKYLISQGREDAEVSFQLAVSFHESGQADSAITWYDTTVKRAVDLAPDNLLANSHLAFMLFRRREFESAWEYLSHALAIDPDHPQPHFYLAIFFWENRMYKEALEEWEKVTALDPDSYLGKKAEENIVILQKALNATTIEGRWDPER